MIFEFKFPDVGEGIAEGEIVKWLVKEGDLVKEDQLIVEVETDKAVAQLPSPKAGKILKIHHKEGDTVKVGETLVSIETREAEAPRPKTTAIVGELEESERILELPKGEEREEKEDHVLATPATRRLAKELNIDITKVQGSGAEGRITEEDIRKYGESQKIKSVPKIIKKYDLYGYVERIALRGVRKSIAQKMVKSIYTATHVTHMDEADLTELFAIREHEKHIAEKKGAHLTYLPFVIKALIEALKLHPLLNSTLDDEHEEIIVKKYYNIGMAVDTPDGLIVPVVKAADEKSLFQIAEEIEALANKTRAKKIDLGDLRGGTFTITNVGGIGGTYATPIINYPEVAILAMGKIEDKPVVKDGRVVAKKILPLSLSFDHRVVDGAEAARFVNDLIKLLEDRLFLMRLKR